MRHIENGDFDHQTYGNATCLCCRAPKKVGDSGIFRLRQDEWGAYDLCESCVVEMAALVGMIPADKADELRKSNRRYGSLNKELKEQVQHYQSIVASLYGRDEE